MVKRKKTAGLVTSLSVGATLPVVLVVLALGLTTLFILEDRIEILIQRKADETLSMMETIVTTEVDSAIKNYLRGIAEKNRELMSIYHQKSLSGEMSRGEAWSAVREIFLSPDYGKIGDTGYLAGVSTKGVLAIHPASEGVDASGAAFMQEAMAMKNGYLEYEWQNVDETEPRMKAGYLAHFAPWDIMVWASSYKEEFLSLLDRAELDNRITQIQVDETGYLLLRDKEGKLLAGRDRLRLLEAVDLPRGTTAEKAVKQGPMRLDSRVLPETDWEIVLVSPLGAYQQVIRLFQIAVPMAILLAALFLHLIIRYLLTRRLKPLQTMRAMAASLSEGDLTVRVEQVSEDEIGEISEIINHVMEEFSRVLLRMQSVETMVTQSIQNLSSSAQEIASTSNEQAAAVKEILSTMEDADQVSKSNMIKVEEVTRIAGSTKDNVTNGFALIKSSLGKMEEIKETNSENIAGIRNLGERINSIWDIVNIINSIADQTKIIAFNAELEAAAAGEAGKNFQIVAGEIRRLADGTVNSTKEIKAKINEIQHASDRLIMASEEGTQRITEGWKLSSELRGIFEEVLNSSEITAHSSENISRSTRMQVSSFEQIFTTLKQVSESIDSFVESTNYTNEVSDHLKEIADSFHEVVNSFTLKSEEPPEQTEEDEEDDFYE